MRWGLLLGLVVLLASASSGYGKPPDGLPTWLAASERQVITSLGNPRTVAIFHIPYPHKIAVVFEFQQPTTCGRLALCPSLPGHPLQARVFRISFDRRTHTPNAEMRLCEVDGVTPPLSRCLAR